MQLINQTRSTVLARELVIAKSFLKRSKGLLGRAALDPEQALLLDPCNSVHTFFMRFAIDLLFLDKNNRVIKAIPSLKPNRLSPIFWGCCRVVELPAGKINLTKTQAGDQLKLAD